MSGTPSTVEIPGWYINFQAAVIKQLPRPGEIDQDVAEGWDGNQASLKKVLGECLLPSVSALTPPPGANLYTVRIRFKPDHEWQEAVNAGGPDTPGNYNVRKVGDQYPPTGTEEIEEDLILLNFPNGDGFDKAQVWAASKQLEKTVPREVFAVGEQYPKLHEKLGQNPMYVVATKECSFGGDRGACDVWWGGSERRACLDRVESFGCRDGWFAFRNPALKT